MSPQRTTFDPPGLTLAHCRLFRHMSADELSEVNRQVEWRDASGGEVIVDRMETGGSLYLVAAGLLLAHQYSHSGREVGFRRLGPGEHFGELGALDGRPRSVTITALAPTRLGRLSKAMVVRLLDISTGFRGALIEDLVADVRRLSERIFDLSVLPVSGRVAVTLLRQGLEAGVRDNTARIERSPTHAEMATLIGAQREGVTRELGRLEAEGLVLRRGRLLTLPDVSRLAAEVERAGGEPIVPR